VWDTALASAWEQPPVWVHADVTASNLLGAGGALRADIDFGCAAVGDPACDLAMAWTFFTGDSARCSGAACRSTIRRGLAAAGGSCGRRLSPWPGPTGRAAGQHYRHVTGPPSAFPSWVIITSGRDFF
jgi:aminoglycoside phosphotransferase (APT) family kinase protein